MARCIPDRERLRAIAVTGRRASASVGRASARRLGLQPDNSPAVGRASARRGVEPCDEMRRPEGRPTTPLPWVGLQPDAWASAYRQRSATQCREIGNGVPKHRSRVRMTRRRLSGGSARGDAPADPGPVVAGARDWNRRGPDRAAFRTAPDVRHHRAAGRRGAPCHRTLPRVALPRARALYALAVAHDAPVSPASRMSDAAGPRRAAAGAGRVPLCAIMRRRGPGGRTPGRRRTRSRR